jgi:hypothetical protein
MSRQLRKLERHQSRSVVVALNEASCTGLTSDQLRSFFRGYVKELTDTGCEPARVLAALEELVIELSVEQGRRCGDLLYALGKKWKGPS